MLRFAFVTTFYPPHHFGGDAELVRHMAESLVRAGHRVDVIYDADAYRALRGSAANDVTTIAAATAAGASGAAGAENMQSVRVHALRSRLGALSPVLTHQLGRPVVHGRTIERLLAGGVDVVHYHNVSLVGGPGVLRLGDALKLYTAHEHWLVCPTHVLWRHDREPCTARQCLRCLAHYRRPPQVWRYTGALERGAAHVDVFCSPSRFSMEKHREFGFDRPMELLPPFLPDETTGATAKSSRIADGDSPSGPPVFLFVGRLERIKGLDDVIPVFKTAEGTAELWIAGTGDHEAALRRLAAGAPRVRFLGRVAPDEVRRLLRVARALVVPSAGFEVFPLVLLEAFREGTPVIARRLGPFPEVVESAKAGLLFATTDELRSAIDRLATDVELARRLGASARASFETHWSERAFLSRYYELIAGAAQRRGRASVAARVQSAMMEREEVSV